MRICHCHAVTDRDIADAISAGARSVGRIAKACRAGSCCGGCIPAVRELLEAKVAADPALRTLPIAAE